MVLDTSALLAIFLNEPERDTFLAAIIGAARRLVSVATVLETGIVLEARKGEAAGRELDLFLHAGAIEQVAVDVEQLELARLAFRRYGKDRSSAGLTWSDCFSYALAHVSGEPLLAKGTGFRQTDIALVPLSR